MSRKAVRKAARAAQHASTVVLGELDIEDLTRDELRDYARTIKRAGNKLLTLAAGSEPGDPTDPPVDPPYEPPDPPEDGVPPDYQWGNPTIMAEPGKVTLRDGTIITSSADSAVADGHHLSVAIRRARRGDVIGVRGWAKGCIVGAGDLNKKPVAAWPNGQPVRDLVVVGVGAEPAEIRGEVGYVGDVMAPGDGGCHEVTFANLVARGERACFIVYQDTRHGRLRWYDVLAEALNPGVGYGGYGLKWGWRGHGTCTPDQRRCRAKKAQEHNLGYWDAVGANDFGDTYMVDLEALEPSGRTNTMLVNRAFQTDSAAGNVYVRNFKGTTKRGEGGSALTVVGHPGLVDVDGFEYDGDSGAIVFWSDAGKGLYLDPNGFTTTHARVRNVKIISPEADRAAIMVSGVGLFELGGGLDITTQRFGLDVNTSTGGPVKTGRVELDLGPNPSQHPGWPDPEPLTGGSRKVRVGGKVLTDAQIDILVPAAAAELAQLR